MAQEYTCENVYADNPGSIERLAKLICNSNGPSMKKHIAKALATTMAYCLEGHVSGYWGDLFWKREGGQFETGKVVFHW